VLLLPLFLTFGACTRQPEPISSETTIWEEHIVKSGETLSNLVEAWQVPSPSNLLQVMKDSKHGVVRLGERIRIHKSPGPVEFFHAIEFPVNSRVSKFYHYNKGNWAYSEETKNFTEKIVKYSGTVETTLWASAEKAGMDIQLLIRLSDIFAWVIDFSREIQRALSIESLALRKRRISMAQHHSWSKRFEIVQTILQNAGII
jgi:hypothetical protein